MTTTESLCKLCRQYERHMEIGYRIQVPDDFIFPLNVFLKLASLCKPIESEDSRTYCVLNDLKLIGE